MGQDKDSLKVNERAKQRKSFTISHRQTDAQPFFEHCPPWKPTHHRTHILLLSILLLIMTLYAMEYPFGQFE